MAAESSAFELAAESAQRSASLTDVVAVRGGGIPLDASLHHAWFLTPEVVDGRSFVDIYTGDHRCKVYLNNNFAMVERLKKLRGAKGAALMQELASDDDPNGCISLSSEDRQLGRPKRELIDKIANIIEVEVETRSGVQATVSVLPSWRKRSVLQIELSQTNLDLLLETPGPEPAPFTPIIEQPDVVWVKDRNHVRCRYWDSKANKWRTKSQSIKCDSDMDDCQKQAIVTREAIRLQPYVAADHDGSAESAPQPSRKAAKTEVAAESCLDPGGLSSSD